MYIIYDCTREHAVVCILYHWFFYLVVSIISVVLFSSVVPISLGFWSWSVVVNVTATRIITNIALIILRLLYFTASRSDLLIVPSETLVPLKRTILLNRLIPLKRPILTVMLGFLDNSKLLSLFGLLCGLWQEFGTPWSSSTYLVDILW